jgi:hypothetical protein
MTPHVSEPPLGSDSRKLTSTEKLADNVKDLASQAHDLVMVKLSEVDGLTATIKCKF